MGFKIGVRIKMIYKLGLTSKIGAFGRFERCPVGNSWHLLGEFGPLSYKLILSFSLNY
jgi:hypothetical protein